MDFRQLESFLAIAKHGSFTKAANELYLTQPTLTGHIQSLENKLGTVLLDRVGKTVTLTEAGRILFNHAVNILNMREQALFALAQYEGKFQGELVIASSTFPQRYLLPKLLTSFNREYPLITYLIKQFDSQGVLEAIISGSMDFGFVGTATSYSELEMLKLSEDRLILITAAELENGGEGTVVWEQIKTEKFILREEGSATRNLFLQSLQEKGVALKDLSVVACIENPDTIKQCVRAGLGAAVVSEHSVQEELRLGLLKGYRIADLDLGRSFYFIAHKKRVLNPISRVFRDFTLRYCHKLAVLNRG